MPSILLIGDDEMLLHTRAAVLRKTGAAIFQARGREALDCQAKHGCEVAIFCHSIAIYRVEEVALALRQGWPNIRLMMLTNELARASREVGSLVDELSTSEPEKLLERTRRMLEALPVATQITGA